MKWILPALLLIIGWFGSCHQATAPAYASIGMDTTLFARPQVVGTIHDPKLAEISGLAAGIQNPGYLWVEEDSGNPNQIQLISPTGTVVGRFGLPALVNYDWEDIATATDPKTGQARIYLAEIGDNAAQPINRLFHQLMHWSASKPIYRFAEPVLTGSGLPVSSAITAIDTLTLTLPYGPRDVEALLVEPATNDIYLLTKGKSCEVYRAGYPQSRVAATPMEHLLTLPFIKVTSAALSPDGAEILIRTYDEIYYYRRRAGESIADALSKQPWQLPLPDELQGEAIGWCRDGSGFYSISEVLNNRPQRIYLYRRLPPATRP